MHISRKLFSRKLSAGLCLLAGAAALASTEPVGAQVLRLGTLQTVRPVLSGSATVNATGTSASGNFTFLGGATTATTTYRGIEVLNASTFNLGPGGVVTSIFNQNTGIVNINGGTLTQGLAYSTSLTNIYGGTIQDMHEVDNSAVNVYGGATSVFETDAASTLDVFGTNLTETYLGMNPATATTQAAYFYTLTGILQNGTALNSTYASVGSVNALSFNNHPAIPAVPEASTTVSLGLLLALGLGGAAVAARKKKTMA